MKLRGKLVTFVITVALITYTCSAIFMQWVYPNVFPNVNRNVFEWMNTSCIRLSPATWPWAAAVRASRSRRADSSTWVGSVMVCTWHLEAPGQGASVAPD